MHELWEKHLNFCAYANFALAGKQSLSDLAPEQGSENQRVRLSEIPENSILAFRIHMFSLVTGTQRQAIHR